MGNPHDWLLCMCRKLRKPDYNKLVPLVYAPLLPLRKPLSDHYWPSFLALLISRGTITYETGRAYWLKGKIDSRKSHVSSLHSGHRQHLAWPTCTDWWTLMFAVRIGLNNRVAPRTRDLIFGGAVLTALIHAGYVMSSDSTLWAFIGS